MTRLVIDGNYLCHRAFHSTGGLEHGSIKTGVIYGVIRTALTLVDEHAARLRDVIWCFDSRTSLRKKMLPTYKENRGNLDKYTEDQKVALQDMYRQIEELRTNYLPRMGFKNIYYQEGYEADDLIATTVFKLRTCEADREIIIVSADRDLFQLITDKVMIWNATTKRMMDMKAFQEWFEIHPFQWAIVKSIAGCSTDNVPGLAGVGEITAIKYLTNKMKKDSKTYQAIRNYLPQAKKNLNLVKLPFKGTKIFPVKRSTIDLKAWKQIAHELGFTSMTNSLDTRTRLFPKKRG